MMSRSKSQPSIIGSVRNKQILGFGSSQPRFPSSSKSSPDETTIRKSTSDFHTRPHSLPLQSNSPSSQGKPATRSGARTQSFSNNHPSSEWSGFSSLHSSSSSEGETHSPLLNRHHHHRVTKSISQRSPADVSEFGAGAAVPDEEHAEEIEARCRRPSLESRGQVNRMSNGGFNEEGLRAAANNKQSNVNHGQNNNQNNIVSQVGEKNKLSQSEFADIINFNLKSSWHPFDVALKLLALPDALELRQPAVIKPDGRQELVYKDGGKI